MGIRFDFSPEPADLNVDAAIEGSADAAARQVEKLIAGQDVLRMLSKSYEQVIFAGREFDERPLRVL